jgi:hypothetical protein
MNSFNFLFLALLVAAMAAMKNNGVVVQARLEAGAAAGPGDHHHHRDLGGMKTPEQKQDIYDRCCVADPDGIKTITCRWGASNDEYPNCCCPIREWSFAQTKWDSTCADLAAELNL